MEKKLDLYFMPYYKINFRLNEKYKCKDKTIKIREENIK